MLVMKFGGTSLRDGPSIETVIEIVRARREEDLVLVVSAHAGVTDALEALAEKAVAGHPDLEPIQDMHEHILTELGLPGDPHAALLSELTDLCRGISLVGELSPRSMDYVSSFGERLSARTLAAALSKQGLQAEAVDAFDAGLVSDSNFGRARLLPDDGRVRKFLEKVEGIPVITGFIAKDRKGDISTLGRNGSDTTAAFIGNALDAREIQIWTDVDGVLTADPKIVPAARPISKMCFDEAAELANQGGKVLHPASLGPALEKEIPVRVLNTHHSHSPGTLILPAFEDPEVVVRCIAHKRHITLVTVQSSRMVAEAGFLARLFGVFERHGISVDMVSTSEVSVSVTLDNTGGLSEAAGELSRFAEVGIEENLAQICVVGHSIRHRMGVPARVFVPLKQAGVEVRMISLGALKVNVSLLVGDDQTEMAVRALHREFFEGGGG